MTVSESVRGNRLSIRVRLTLLYGGMVFASGVVLLLMVYLLMRFIPNYDIREAQLAVAPAIPANPTDQRPTPIPTIASKDDVLAVLLQLSGLALLGLALIAFLLGWIIAGRILAPVHRITSAARTVAGHTLHERIQLDGPKDEFTELADTIDTMLDRLHTSFQAQQRFAANASHELRTPLATTRTMLQVALARPQDHDLATLAPKLLATNERSITTVESLLTLSRADHGVAEPMLVDIASVAAHAVDQVRAEAESRRIGLATDLRPATVDGDGDLVHHLLLNLLHNAVRHNHPGGAARLSTTSWNGAAVITVTNTGEPVSAAEAARLFEPFHRGAARTRGAGHGLGLTLVRTIAHSHHGTATAMPNAGGGLTTTVVLPLRQAEHPRMR
ncbi:sensor histidine kinase [Prauserella cavernicola]|uniref:histidine kinase n=1 Tax=Prauserella cavernicola TaxID=2800127 RepID=A0A934V4K7_9PSEU|nr:HAMP domain-containing sensor histidine kinase [Prauserella cavernicola]MBK1783688.1 HAMP domain-containing histidine kinase [Prauserella cavernicola]